MLFLLTHHMNSPQMNQTALQCHHSTHPDLHRAHGALQRAKTQTETQDQYFCVSPDLEVPGETEAAAIPADKY